MCDRVRQMKHSPGLAIEHFISADDYDTAMAALEDFWEYVVKNERVTGA